MADPETESLRDMVASIAQSTQRLKDTSERLADGIARQGNVATNTINAGGVTNAVTACLAVSAIVMFIIFASAMSWLYAQERGTREAWSDVYRAEQSQMRSEWNRFKQENSNAGR